MAEEKSGKVVVQVNMDASQYIKAAAAVVDATSKMGEGISQAHVDLVKAANKGIEALAEEAKAAARIAVERIRTKRQEAATEARNVADRVASIRKFEMLAASHEKKMSLQKFVEQQRRITETKRTQEYEKRLAMAHAARMEQQKEISDLKIYMQEQIAKRKSAAVTQAVNEKVEAASRKHAERMEELEKQHATAVVRATASIQKARMEQTTALSKQTVDAAKLLASTTFKVIAVTTVVVAFSAKMANAIFRAVQSVVFAITRTLANALKTGATAIGRFVSIIGKGVAGLFKLRDGTDNLSKSTRELAKDTQKSGSVMQEVWKRLTSPVTMASLAVRDFFKSTTRRVREFLQTLGEAISEMQRLRIQFESLAARDIARSLGIETADAFAMAAVQAKHLEMWVKRIAVLTPFEVSSVAAAVAWGNAMGLNIEMAKRLTIATGNFVSAMGLTEDHMDRIIYNFGQMHQQGKLTGREFRDLAISFVPVYDILGRMAQRVGMSTMAFRDLAFEGGVPVMEFFEEFINMANNDFPNAMEKMARTWDGVQNNIRDFINVVVGVEMLGPVINRITNMLADFLNETFTGALYKRARMFGMSFGMAFDDASKGVNKLTGALGNAWKALTGGGPSIRRIATELIALGLIFQYIGKTAAKAINDNVVPALEVIGGRIQGAMAKTIGDAYSWGVKLVEQLAHGIISGIGTALTWAIQALTGFFTGWLAPRSPPPFLPQIFNWGLKTMAEWMRGFTSVDFDALDSIQNALRGSLEGLEALGFIAEESIRGTFVGLSEDLIQAIHQFNTLGEVGDAIFQKLAAVGDVFGDELALLLEKQFALITGVKEAEAAEKALLAAIEATKRARGTVNTMTREYNAMLRAGASKEVLNLKLKELNAAEDAMWLAEKEQQAAQERKDAADAMLGPLREAVRLQERLIEQLIELAKAQKDALAGGGGGADPDTPEPPDFGLGNLREAIEDEVEKMLKNIRQEIIRQLEGVWNDLIERWENEIRPGLQRILELFGMNLPGIIDKFKSIFAKLREFLQTYGPGIWQIISDTISQVLYNLGYLAGLVFGWMLDRADDWAQWLLDNGPTIQGFLQAIGTILVKLSGLAIVVWNNLAPALTEAQETLQVFLEVIMRIAQQPWVQNVIDRLVELGGVVSAYIGENAVRAFKWWQQTLLDIEAWFSENGPLIEAAVDNIARIIEEVFKRINDNWPVTETIMNTLKNTIMTLATAALQYLGGDTANAVNTATQAWENFKSGISDAMTKFDEINNTGVMQTIKDNVELLGDYVRGAAVGFEIIANTDLSAFTQQLDIFVALVERLAGGLGITDENTSKIEKSMGKLPLVELANDIVKIIEGLAEVATVVMAVINILTALAGIIALVLLPVWEAFKGGLYALFLTVGLIVKGVYNVIVGYLMQFQAIINFISALFSGDLDGMTTALGEFIDGVEKAMLGIVQFIAGATAALVLPLTVLFGQIVGFWKGVILLFTNMYDTLIGHSIIPDMLEAIYNSFNTWLGDILLLIIEKIAEFAKSFIIGPTEMVQLIKDWVAIGSDLIGGMVEGVTSGVQNLVDEVVAGVKDAIQAAKDALLSKSPSKVAAEIGKDMMLGMAEGVESSAGVLYDAVFSAVSDGIEGAQDAINRGEGFMRIASGFKGAFQRQEIDPLKSMLGIKDADIAALEKRLAELISKPMDEAAFNEMLAVDARLYQLKKDRLGVLDQIEEKERKLLELEEQQQQLAFLRQQLDMIAMLKDFGLNPAEILGGMELGLGASAESMIEAMIVAIQAMIEAANDELQISSPSKVMEKIGKYTVGGLVKGISKAASSAASELSAVADRMASVVATGNSALSGQGNTIQPAQSGGAQDSIARRVSQSVIQPAVVRRAPVSAPPVVRSSSIVFGDTNIYNTMDAAQFRQSVLRVIREAL